MGIRTASSTTRPLFGVALLFVASCTSDGPTSLWPGSGGDLIKRREVGSVSHFSPIGVLQGRRVASLTISPTTATVNVGCVLQLTGSALDAGGNPVSIPVTWSSSNTAVARMDQTGLVTGVSSGSATVTGSAQGKRTSAVITVTAAVGSGTLCIQIDARALTAANFGISGVGTFPTMSGQALRLSAGGYALTAADGEVVFEVTPAGTVDYDPALEGVLTGKGTATLRAAGALITIDATGLSAATFLVSGVVGTSYSTATPQALRLLPNIDAAHPYALAAADGEVVFEVTPVGTVDYEPALEGVLTGKGTGMLRAAGAGITIVAAALGPSSSFSISGIGTFSAVPPLGLRLLPSIDSFHAYGFASATLSFAFLVTRGGLLDYDHALDSSISGRGTSTLTIL